MAQAKLAREDTATLALGLLAFCTGVIVIMVALVLGAHFEASDVALANSAKGQKIAVPAVIAVIASVVALTGRRRRWGRPVAFVAAAAAVLAVLLAFLIPGGSFD